MNVNKKEFEENKNENEKEQTTDNEKFEKKENKEEKEEKEENEFEKLFEEANYYYELNNYQKAEELYKNIINMKNKLEISKEKLLELYINIANNFYNQLKFNESIEHLSYIIINLDKNNKNVFLLLLNILYEMKEYNHAERLIEKIKKKFNENELKYFEKIFYLINEGIKEENEKKEIEKNYKTQKFYTKIRENKYVKFLFFFSLFIILLGSNLLGKYLTKNLNKNYETLFENKTNYN